MGGVFGGTPPVQQTDTSYIDQQRKEAEEQKAKLARENQAKRKARRRTGKSLLLYDDERGVRGEATLG